MAPPVPGGGPRPAKRSQPRSAQSLVLLVGGGVVLIALSVVATVFLINRHPETKTDTPIAKPRSDSTSPVTSAPIIKVPLAPIEAPPEKPTASTPAPIPPPPPKSTAPSDGAPPAQTVASTPPKTETKPVAAPETKTPATSVASPPEANAPKQAPAHVATQTPVAPAPEAVAPTPAPAKSDERVHAFVDSVRVQGIRSSGGESRVLMNDRVYRVNDIVERSLGVRLTKVEPDNLTFTDANGVTYVKFF